MSTENFKKLLDLSNITDQKTRELVELGVGSFFCANVLEKFPRFDKAPCEHVYRGSHNSEIVLGRDRYESWASGAGGKGLLQCGMIDLVAGRGQLVIAANQKNNAPNLLEGVELTGPMFHADAARVYITQKSENVDQYFGLKPSRGSSPEMKSAIATKADHIRVIGREKVKIYCGQGNFEGFESGIGETNSLGQRLSNQVIELQVGSLESHPMVLGNNLVKYLKKQNENQRKLQKALFNIQLNLTAINTALAVLTFGAPPFSVMTKDSIQGVAESITESINSFIGDLNALDSELIPGQDHILSQTVFTT
jgi:hypothetical protein